MRRTWIHILLFVLTIASTWLTGGPGYSIAVMLILLGHELGHYFVSRSYGMRATLPYFLPCPFISPLGTLGAIIKLEGSISSRKALFDTGAAGPLISFCLSIPAVVIGLRLSDVIPVTQVKEETFGLGSSLLFSFMDRVFHGEVPATCEVILHPIGYAGWVGLFVTALNLLPVGQLDGGHVVYALFGKKSRVIFHSVVALVAFFFIFYSIVWFLPLILMILFGFRHPTPLDDETPVDRKRKFVGGVVLLMLILSFTPAPIPEIPSLMEVFEKGFPALLNPF